MIYVLVVEDEKKFHQFYVDVLSGFNKDIDVIRSNVVLYL